MASKKKPLWLEFHPAPHPAPPLPPVGTIFKEGADLRPAMLVLRVSAHFHHLHHPNVFNSVLLVLALRMLVM